MTTAATETKKMSGHSTRKICWCDHGWICRRFQRLQGCQAVQRKRTKAEAENLFLKEKKLREKIETLSASLLISVTILPSHRATLSFYTVIGCH